MSLDLDDLVCPVDHSPLSEQGSQLECQLSHCYPVIDGIPILLPEDAIPIHPAFRRTPELVHAGSLPPQTDISSTMVDAYVQENVVNTCGQLYSSLKWRLTRYPIPDIRLPQSSGERLLDIGCNWGRWSISAAQKGYVVTGVDPYLEALLAARRIAEHNGHAIRWVVADGRRLPFANGSFDVAYCYSVLQHMALEDTRDCLRQIRHILRQGGTCLIEMPNALGPLNLVRQASRRFREPKGFEVRYHTPYTLLQEFEQIVGETEMVVDSYFFINGQPADLDLLPGRYRLLIRISEALRRRSLHLRPLVYLADSLFFRTVIS